MKLFSTFSTSFLVFIVSEMIFNILQQLEMLFGFVSVGGKPYRSFLSCHGLSFNLIETSPFPTSSRLSSRFSNFHSMRRKIPKQIRCEEKRQSNSQIPYSKCHHKIKEKENFSALMTRHNPSNLSLDSTRLIPIEFFPSTGTFFFCSLGRKAFSL